MSQSNGRTTRTFRITGFSQYGDSLKKLAKLNPDWNLSPEEIVESGKAGQKIFKLKFTNRPVQLQPESGNPNAIAVIVAGYQIGFISKEESSEVRNILSNCDIQSIACGIWGGQSKVVDEFYSVETQNQGISITVRIVYNDWTIPDDDDFVGLLVEEDKPIKRTQKKSTVKKAKKPFFKRWWFWAIVVLLVIFLFGGNSDSEENPASSANTNGSASDVSAENSDQSPAVPKATTPESIPLETAGALGDHDVQIHDFEIADDYSGTPAILIGFTFTNNSEENASAIVSLVYNAYQNGVALDSAIIMDSNIYSADDLMKEIQPGASINLKAAYVLTSETAPVEFEIAEAFAFTNDQLGKTFEISAGGITELRAAPSGSISGDLGICNVSIVSYKLTKDYEGNSAILFELGFTNNSNTANNFLSTVDFSAFQNGVELEMAILIDEESVDSGSTLRNVKPGAGIPVTIAYVLTSETSPVSIEIEDVWGFSGNIIETEIDLT